MVLNTFNLSVVILLFGQMLAQVISGLSNDVIPAMLLILGSVSILLLTFACFSRPSLKLLKFQKIDFSLFLLFLCFYLSAFFLGHGTSTDTKVFASIYLILAPMLLLFFFTLSVKTIDMNKLMLTSRRLATISILLAFLLFLFGATHSVGDSSKVSIDGVANTIWLGRYLGVFVVILTLTMNKKNFVVTTILILIALFLLFMAGSRGPLVALLSAIVFAKAKLKPRYTFLIILTIVSLPFMLELTSVSDYFLGKADFSNYSRIQLISASVDLIERNTLFGIGFGNFGSYFKFFDDSITYYPHNILVEVFVECGIIAFLILLALIVKTFVLGRDNVFMTSVFLYAFVNALFSGDINGNSIFFTSMFLIRLMSGMRLIGTASENPKARRVPVENPNVKTHVLGSN